MNVRSRNVNTWAAIAGPAALLLLLLIPGPLIAGAPAGIHLSPTGSDDNDGSAAHPFATLERARDAVRQLKRDGALPRQGVTVWLHAGSYPRTAPFMLTAADSGSAGAPIVYRSIPGERVSINGGREVEFTKVTDEAMLAQFSEEARPNIRVADVHALQTARLTPSFSQFLSPAGPQLYYGGAPMTVASWPNDGWSHIKSLPTGQFSGRFEYETDRPGRWTHLADIFLHGYWAYDWFDSYETVRSIDPATHQIQTNYVPPPNAYGFVVGQRYRALNVAEELDQPGEWYLDRDTARLYFWPPSPSSTTRATLAVNDTPLTIIDGASYVTFEGLVFETNRASGIEISNGTGNSVVACVLRNLGTFAIAIGQTRPDLRYTVATADPLYDGHAGTDNGVRDSLIYNTGKGGVILGGGDRRTLVPAANYVTNTELHDFSLSLRTGGAAVFVYGVGNLVAHNKIYSAPQTAIFIWGNNHTVEFNDISRVCLDVADAGAINYGRDYSQRGTIIRYNYIHDMPGEDGGHIGVYLDDFGSGTIVYGNVFARVSLAVNIGGGRENLVDNNIFVDCTRAVHIQARGLTWQKQFFDGTDPLLKDLLRLVNYRQPPYSTAYPLLPTIMDDDPGAPKYNRVTRNIIVGGKQVTYADGAEAWTEAKDNFIGDPSFISSRTDDYRLLGDSPAFGIGFRQIPMKQIGLRTTDEAARTRRRPTNPPR